jgi:hypothetical protein
MKLLRLPFAAAVAIYLMSIGQVSADDKANFSKMVSDPIEQKQVLNVAKNSGVVVNDPCPSANFSILNQFAIYKPLAFDGSGRPMEGAWKQSVAEKGCGQDRLLNVFFWLDANSSVRVMPLFPGTTRADPQLQKDAMPHAAIAAQWPEKDCKTGYMENTEFIRETGEPLEGAKGKPWDELWTLASCAKKAKVTLHFIPDKTGTTIHTSLQETKFLPNKLAQ